MNQEQLRSFSKYLELLKSPLIAGLLRRQADLDKYCLAACFVYFLRAKLDPNTEYTGKNFALCLYIDNLIQDDDCLANDPIKNDIEDLCEMYGLYGTRKAFRSEVFCFLQKMNWRAIVSYRTAHAICLHATDNPLMLRLRTTSLISRKRSLDLLDELEPELEPEPCHKQQREPLQLLHPQKSVGTGVQQKKLIRV